MTNETESAGVTQADREAAYHLLMHSGDTLNELELARIAEMRAGKWDSGPSAQAFARHRATAEAGKRELVEALRAVMPYVEPARLREEAQASAMEINRMPVRSVVRKANEALAKHGDGA